MTGIRVGTVTYASIAEALRAVKAGDVILLDPSTFSAPLLLTSAQGTTLKGSGSSNQTILLNTPILERSGQGKFAPGFTIQDLAFEYRNQSGYLFSPSIGSLPYNPTDPTLTSFRLKNIAFTGIHKGGFSGTYTDISGAKNTIFDNIRVSLSGQASFDPIKGTGGGYFVFSEGGADIQILNSEFNEAGFSGAFIVLYVSDALVASNRFIGGGIIRQDDGTNPADNPRGERFVNAGGTFANNHLSNGAFFDYLLQFNSDLGTIWTDYKTKFATTDGTFGLRTSVIANTFDIISSGYGVLIRADISPQIVEKMLSISGNVFNNGLAIRSDLTESYDLAFGQNYVNGILFDHLRVGGTGHDKLNANRTIGRNWISGGLGNDQLYSSPGRLDAFVFYTSPNPQSNTDSILGFETGGPEPDQIWLDGEVFRGLLNNGDQLDTRSFTSNSSGVAIGNAGQIIYNTSTGELSYDGDGAGNSNPARFAILSGKESVSLQDFRLFNRTYSSPAFPVITLAVTPASVLENGPTNLLYTFTRTGSTASPLTVNYAISGSADGTDYTGVTPGFGKTITFPAGSATASVSVNPTADTGVEPNETIALSLAAGTGYTIGTTSPVVGTIANDDLPPPPVISPPVITLAVSPASVPEDGPNNLIYTFSRTGSTTSALTVNYTAAGTATLGIDYSGIAATPATITFAPGSSTATLTVDPTTDSSIEPNETVALTLTAGAGYIIGTPAAAIGTITNDDSAFAIAPLASNKGEGRSGPTPFTFTVSRLGSAAAAGSVRWTVAGSGSNPTNAADFTGATSGTLSFAAGQASRILTINALGDLRQERDETFAVRLSTPTGAILGPTVVAAATIRNDDQIGDQNPNTLRGGNLPDWVDGRGNGTTGDILTGGGAGDTFAFRFRESPLTAPDAITDFAFGVDKIDLFSPPGGALGAPRSLSRAARNSTATTLGALAAAVFADANGARPGNQVLTANGAALVQATNPAIAGTYLLINNATAGRSDLDDLLIKLGGSLPGLPPVGVVAVGTVFA